MKTKNILKLAAVCAAIMTVGMAQIHAATTNLVQDISFTLTFYEQGATNHNGTITTINVNKIKVTTKDVIAAIGAATTNSFSSKAKLVLVRDASSTTNVSFYEIRDGTNPPVDVTGFFSRSQSDSVYGSSYDSATGIDTGVNYSVLHILLANASLTAGLDLKGFATTTHASIKDKADNTVIGVDTIEADVSGTGVDTHGVSAVVNGSVSILGKTLKIE